VAKKKSSKKMGKGKKALIIAGGAAAGELLVGTIATIAAPLTGGLTTPIAATMYSLAAKDIPIVAGIAAGGAVAGAGTAAVVTKKIDAGKETEAYKSGYTTASKAWEAKYFEQARKFAKQAEEWHKTEQAWKQAAAEKDDLLQECLKYIKDLEKERDDLKARNKTLTKEKQDLLDELYRIKKELSVA
jgi:hypothetical protein